VRRDRPRNEHDDVVVAAFHREQDWELDRQKPDENGEHGAITAGLLRARQPHDHRHEEADHDHRFPDRKAGRERHKSNPDECPVQERWVEHVPASDITALQSRSQVWVVTGGAAVKGD
jgi:sRNA-binding protein